MSIVQQSDKPSNYPNNRSPLISKPFVELPLGAISPEGWLKDQLLRQKNGMTGHLDEIYEKVMGKRNGWLGGDEVVLSLPMQVSVSRWYENSAVVERGPLVYALKIGEEWKKVVNTDKYGQFYYEVLPSTPWNYGLLTTAISNPAMEFEVVQRHVSPDSYPWNQENAPIEILQNPRIATSKRNILSIRLLPFAQ